MNMHSKCLFYLVIVLAFGYGGSAMGNIVEQTMPTGIVATADYRHVDFKKPAILLVHGFLTTRNFRTVFNLSNALVDEGYSVLALTLSLGVDRRNTSLACEAIHLHTLKDDIGEINHWVDWLVKQGNKKIILIGHSYGSLHSLAYSLQNKHSEVKKLIATSLVDIEGYIGTETSDAQILSAKSLLKKDKTQLGEYQISYCKKYITPPQAFLSYAIWSKSKILGALSKLTLPVEIILGRADKRAGPRWEYLLRQLDIQLTLIDGANHFFDAEHELDLLDNVLDSLKEYD